MAYINIPNINFVSLDFNIKYKENIDIENDYNNDIYVSKSLHHYLTKIKENINNISNEWDNYKKITNPYEYIHTQIKNKKLSVCNFKPISRSFFKLIEISNVFNIFTYII